MQRILNNLRIILFLLFSIVWFITSKTPHSFITLTAILLHEAGHILAAAITGNTLKSLSPRDAGLVLSSNRGFSSYGEEAFIAFLGPFFNFLSAIICLLASRSENTLFFSEVSLALGALNMLPVKDFDGGRIAEAFLYGVFPYGIAYMLCEILSFLSLFFLWSISVYVLLRSGESLTLFFFSSLLFSKMLLSELPTQI